MYYMNVGGGFLGVWMFKRKNWVEEGARNGKGQPKCSIWKVPLRKL